MRRDVHRAAEALAKGFVAFGRIAVAMNRPDAKALPRLRLAKYVIASGAGKEVTRREAEIGQRVLRAVGLQQLVKNVRRADLLSAPLGMNPTGVIGQHIEGQFALKSDGRLIKDGQILLR